MKKHDYNVDQLDFSPITFGAWAIGEYEFGGVEPDESVRALHRGFELGFRSIDTAPCYGLGLSEEVVGKAIKGYPRERIQIQTKCGIVTDGIKGKLIAREANYGQRGIKNVYVYAGRDSIIKECEQSLKRLNTEYIDLYSLHAVDTITPIEELAEAFEQLKKQGKIRFAGVCNHSLEDLKKINSITSIKSNKVYYSLLNREIEKDIVPYCKENGIELFAYNIFQRRMLTDIDDYPIIINGPHSESYRNVLLYKPTNSEYIKKIRVKLKEIAVDYGISVKQLAIKWVAEQPFIKTQLLDAISKKSIEEYVASLNISLNTGDIREINILLNDFEKKLDTKIQDFYVENNELVFKDF
ncbi:aldo/keto reductase [Flagellimonas marinaquae]|nr:aldo/keto reductase [Ahrensia sp.]UBZ13186.1 aldo/keto reductase [Allomuricauda aquimarina]|tara:strand:- start:6262 stop:7323 length:1062 start_codon:yes stop_codon:yes gene_type:complete